MRMGREVGVDRLRLATADVDLDRALAVADRLRLAYEDHVERAAHARCECTRLVVAEERVGEREHDLALARRRIPRARPLAGAARALREVDEPERAAVRAHGV